MNHEVPELPEDCFVQVKHVLNQRDYLIKQQTRYEKMKRSADSAYQAALQREAQEAPAARSKVDEIVEVIDFPDVKEDNAEPEPPVQEVIDLVNTHDRMGGADMPDLTMSAFIQPPAFGKGVKFAECGAPIHSKIAGDLFSSGRPRRVAIDDRHHQISQENTHKQQDDSLAFSQIKEILMQYFRFACCAQELPT